MADKELTDLQKTAIGRKIAKALHVQPTFINPDTDKYHGRMYKTEYGLKSSVGVYELVKDLMESYNE